MSLLVPNSAEADMLRDILAGDHTLHLYTNNKMPAANDEAGSYVEAKGSGYQPITMTGDQWDITPAETKEMFADAAYPEQTFEFSGALGNVFGYFVTRGDGRIRWAERFPNGPVNVSGGHVRIKVAPHFIMDRADQ